jgi:membrane protein implicated in regulation of membrane protease activity
MPLSEDEQRILRQIEEQLQRDPGFGRNLHQRTGGDRRLLVMSGIGAVVCLVLTVALLSVSPYLSFVAFVGALVAALVCERHARSLGEAGFGHLSESVRGRFGQATQHRADD